MIRQPTQPAGALQPPGVVPSQPTQPTIVYVSVPSPHDPDSIMMICPYCHSSISTRVISQPTAATHLFALLLCVLGFWCCVCIPYCMESCQRHYHYCPNCNAFLGVYGNDRIF